MDRKERRWVAAVTLVLVVAGSLPTLAAWAMTPEGTRFTGLVFNPQDANSYLAKMRQGLNGSWTFRLPYTPDPHDGVPVYLFYLFLGHVARWTGLPLIAVYHAARVLGGAVMLVSLYALAARLTKDVGMRRVAFLLAALGAGLGWLSGPLGLLTADLWVPEAFPVYALLTNAHFPLAMGLMAAIALCGLRFVSAGPGGRDRLWGLAMLLAAVALSVIQPFGLVAVFGGLGGMLLARRVREGLLRWQPVAWIAAAGVAALGYALYTVAALRAEPVLAGWQAQNETPSPPLWDWALSYGLVLFLAVPGAVWAVRCGGDAGWLLLGWIVTTVVGMDLPLSLQRRLSLGLGVPLGLLAGVGLWQVVRTRIVLRGALRARGLLQGLAVAFCALTPVFLILMALLAAQGGSPWFYVDDDEWTALVWLRDRGRPGAVVLCAPQTGLFVPAWAGQPVVYGHPFETVDAERRRAQVEAFWAGEMGTAQRKAFLQENRVTYVFAGPRELGGGTWALDLGERVFRAGGVSLYEIESH